MNMKCGEDVIHMGCKADRECRMQDGWEKGTHFDDKVLLVIQPLLHVVQGRPLRRDLGLEDLLEVHGACPELSFETLDGSGLSGQIAEKQLVAAGLVVEPGDAATRESQRGGARQRRGLWGRDGGSGMPLENFWEMYDYLSPL